MAMCVVLLESVAKFWLITHYTGSPSTSIEEINARQALVKFFHGRPTLRFEIIQMLRSIEDVSRIVQKFLAKKGDTAELLALGQTIKAGNAIRARIASERLLEKQEIQAEDSDWAQIDILILRWSELPQLVKQIDAAVALLEHLTVISDSEAESITEDGSVVASPLVSGLQGLSESKNSGSKLMGRGRWLIKKECDFII